MVSINTSLRKCVEHVLIGNSNFEGRERGKLSKQAKSSLNQNIIMSVHLQTSLEHPKYPR